MNLAEAFEADGGILCGADEAHHLLQGGVEAAHHVLHGEHHAEGHGAVHHGLGGKEGDEDVLELVYHLRPPVLPLAKGKGLHLDTEQLGLHGGPRPAALELAAR